MGAPARVLRPQFSEDRLALVDNVECGESIVARAKVQQAEILEMPTPAAPARAATRRRTRAAATSKAPKPGPVEVSKVHPVAIGVADILMFYRGYQGLKIVNANTVLLVNQAPRGRGRRGPA